MKKHIYLSILLVSLLTACSPSAQKGKEGQIDVLPAFENLTELKVSQLGKNVRYVPLETTDSSLIGARYVISYWMMAFWYLMERAPKLIAICSTEKQVNSSVR